MSSLRSTRPTRPRANGGGRFSLEVADGVRFIVRSRLFSKAETAMLKAPPIGPEAAATTFYSARPG